VDRRLLVKERGNAVALLLEAVKFVTQSADRLDQDCVLRGCGDYLFNEQIALLTQLSCPELDADEFGSYLLEGQFVGSNPLGQ
jgi:hypothetical protein